MSPPTPTNINAGTNGQQAKTGQKRARSDSQSCHSLGHDDHHAGGAEALRLTGPDGRTKRYDDEHGIVRKRTNIENVVLDREAAAHEIADALPKEIT
eukprot:CAMPEP_0196143934 /NCGR_PEP_ID=MMETSP0910-20130528/14141_1 /TAXON_ID=49265 /ORGANISM="Thalassiosira rotula, Strain GSO102" /LENGTH=96 /DNA_ID=CAMNT_0041405453 /DNA_START=5 /DNA_END=291 /DNA_ORIENTATION=+